MVTYILMAIITLSYLALILFRRKGRANPQITGPIFLVQGVLWIILAALNWNDVLTVTRVACVVVTVLSFFSARSTVRRRFFRDDRAGAIAAPGRSGGRWRSASRRG